MYRAAALLYPDALATSITLPMEILRAASQMARANDRRAPQVHFLLAAATKQPMRLSSGIVLQPDRLLSELPAQDLTLLPAIWRNPLPTLASADWLPLLNRQAEQGGVICSVGTGSFLLAEAGLLLHKPATTHWNYFRQFSQRYPDVELKTRHLITQADNVYCAGSVNSIADLMLHIVENWFGNRIARAIESQFSPEIRRSFQAAAYQNEADSSHHDELIAQAQQWLREDISHPNSVANLAERLQLSPRTLHRRFKKATGLSPLAYLQSVRMAIAKDLLRHSNLAVGDIAWQVGLNDVSHFSKLFRDHAGVTPLQYRSAVRGKLFSPEQP
ncbi:MAG: helix-turn-helix domain-containing protein [Pseudomonadota bacterium]